MGEFNRYVSAAVVEPGQFPQISLVLPFIRAEKRHQKDLSEYYDAFRIFIVPHRYSAGIPWKLSEAMSRGIPAVVSSLTATQLALTDEKEVLVGHTPRDFANKVVRLYKDEGLWNRIQESALAFIQKTHDPAILKSRLDDIIRSVLQMPAAGRSLETIEAGE